LTDHYCSQKFWWLTVEPERRSMTSCCAATPTKIDLTWLNDHPSELFNTPELIREREMMLSGSAVQSCEATCWSAERRGMPSRRLIMESNQRTHDTVVAKPETVHITLGSDCNLTCSYCCKQFSTAWLHDIRDNGVYFDDDRYNINANDQIVLKLGQNAIKNSNSYQQILTEVQNFKDIKSLVITGGEPFLYNGLTDLVNDMPGQIDIVTGLGVNSKRLIRILDELPSSTQFIVSAENTGALYEFNRYGNSWDNFQRNLDAVAGRFKYRFSSVLSNLTVHGFKDFQSQYATDNDLLSLCSDPVYLGANVLDVESKNQIKQQVYKYHDLQIKQTVQVDCTDQQRKQFVDFVQQFVARRNLTLDIFPTNFTNWIKETPQ
jgi:hypothetical protein